MQQMYSPKQAKTLLEANARWNLLIGATRSGKTYLQYSLIPKRMLEQPPGICMLIAKTMGNVETNLLTPMREIYGAEYISHVYKKANVNYAKVFGRECIVMGADNIRAVDKIRGKSLIYVAGDEGPTWPEDVLNMIKSRMDRPDAKADITGNPEGPYHPFKTDLIDRAEELNVYYAHFTIDDNPFLDPGIKDQMKREHVGVWYKRMILGLWVAAEGTIYDMLDEKRHVVDQLPQMREYHVGVDYGTGSVTTFWLLGIGTDNRLYFVDFWRWDAKAQMRQRTDVEFANEMNRWLVGLNIVPRFMFVPTDALSFLNQLHHSGAEMQASGKQCNFGTVAEADRSPGSVLSGIHDTGALLGSDLLLFSREVERKGGLREWISYVWDDKANERGEDAPVKQNDHSPDAGRYVITGTKHIWYRWLARKAA